MVTNIRAASKGGPMNTIQATTIQEVSEWCEEAGVDAVEFLGALLAGCQDAANVFAGVAVSGAKCGECRFNLPECHAALTVPVATKAASRDFRRVSNFGLSNPHSTSALAYDRGHGSV